MLQDGDVRYVYVTDPSSSGWPAMVKTVRDSDTAKITDCKEDIDTLLVFVRVAVIISNVDMFLTPHRLVFTRQFSQRSSSSRTRLFSKIIKM